MAGGGVTATFAKRAHQLGLTPKKLAQKCANFLGVNPKIISQKMSAHFLGGIILGLMVDTNSIVVFV